MTLPMPTRGPVVFDTEVVGDSWPGPISAQCDELFTWGMDGEEGVYFYHQADIDLIAAAFNAAEAARHMGYDPIAAIQAVPALLRLAESVHANGFVDADAAISAARTREVTQ